MPYINIEDWADRADDNPQWALAYAVLRLAKAQEDVAVHLKYLGNGNASTQMGAIEGHATHLGEKIDRLCDVIYEAMQERD